MPTPRAAQRGAHRGPPRRPKGIDRASPLPFYHQLKQLIVADIAAHERQPGDRLLGDRELCETYEVSRTVVRQALSELEVEGVVVRDRGRGTFVAPAPADEGLIASLTGLHEDLAMRGVELRSEVRKIAVVPADDSQATALDLDVGEPVVHIERLRSVGEEPWVFAVTDVPAWAAPGLEHEDLTDRSLYELLEEKYDVELVRGRRVVEATVAGQRLARLLGVRRSDALLVLRSVSVDEQERPVESFVAFHRGDRSRFEVEVRRQPTSPRHGNPLMVVTDES